jgi:hypothetical protein
MKQRDKELANQVQWSVDVTYGELQKFANLIRADEREACAKVCDDEYFSFVAADAIRARGNT